MSVGLRAPLPVVPATSSPFATVVPAVAVAAGYLAVWLVGALITGVLGGRWLAVHLVVLGSLTNLVVAFSDHFTRALTRTAAPPARWRLPTLNLGIVLVLLGVPTGRTAVLATGWTITVATVTVAALALRRARRAAVGARFGWVVRAYERAHLAFVAAAALGGLLAVGAVEGGWYVATKAAHLHLAVLGFAVVTLLATLVFFGPTVVRTRIEPGADDRAARALRAAVPAVAVAAAALLATGVGGAAGTTARWLAAGALAVFAGAVAVVCVPVARAAWRAPRASVRLSIAAASWWLVVAAVADVAVVASGAWWLLDALGLAALAGVLAQAVLVSAQHVVVTLHRPEARTAVVDRLARHGLRWAVGYNAAVFALVVAAVGGEAFGPVGAVLARGSWALLVAVVASQVVATVRRPASAA